jgi:malonyl-CoA O-methyltransferase
MHDVGDSLMHAGFRNPVMDVEHIEVLFKDTRQLMQELKQQGARNVDAARHRGLTGKHKLMSMLMHYEKYRREDKKFPATYEIIYGHAWGAEPNSYRTNEFAIPLTKIQRK